MTESKGNTGDQSLGAVLKDLDARGELRRISAAVDPLYEMSAVLGLDDTGPAVLFESPTGHEMPVVANLLNSRGRIAASLGCAREELPDRLVAALRNPIPPEIVEDQTHRPVTHGPAPDLTKLLPVPTWFEHESGPYITAGVFVAKHPETGRRNVSIARIRVDGGNRIMAGIAKNHHLNILAEAARKLGRKLPVAVAIGNHPAVLLASQLYIGLGEDEFDIAGALLGEPLRLTRCATVDLEVPAEAEIVLEGELDADELVDEPRVSEFHGFYVSYGPGIGGRIRHVAMREDAVFQAILPGYAAEHCLLGAVAIEAVLCDALSRMIPAVRRVVVTAGGMGRLHAVIVMHRPRLGEGKRAAMMAMGQVNLLKLVIIVEDDIDPEDWRQVEWSLAARFRGHEDLVIVPGVKADRCDPLHKDLTITKIAMIATTRPGDGEPGSRSEFAAPPKAVVDAVRARFDEH